MGIASISTVEPPPADTHLKRRLGPEAVRGFGPREIVENISTSHGVKIGEKINQRCGNRPNGGNIFFAYC